MRTNIINVWHQKAHALTLEAQSILDANRNESRKGNAISALDIELLTMLREKAAACEAAASRVIDYLFEDSSDDRREAMKETDYEW